jgi:hypothetical protein
MADKNWSPRASARPQIDSITVDVAPTAGDTGNVVIGKSTLSVTAGSGTTTAVLYAAALKNAINATQIGENLVSNERRNVAGQSLGEFRDVEAVINPANTAVVWVRSKVPGVPFYDAADVNGTLSESTGGAATLAMTAASVQTATGPNFWSGADNWAEGSVPADTNNVYVANTNISILYGLPLTAALLELASFNVDMSFEGIIGLPRNNPLGYTEYRTRAPDIRDDGTNANNAVIRIGRGTGRGSPFINIKNTLTVASSNTTYHIFNTGKPDPARYGDYSLVINYNANDTGSDVNISGGSVHLESVEINDLNIAAAPGVEPPKVQFETVSVIGGGGDVNIRGGRILYRTAASLNLTVYDGLLEFVGAVPATITMYGGTANVINAASGTISTTIVADKGKFDLSNCTTPITLSTVDLFKGATFLDPRKKATYSAGVDLNQCSIADVTLDLGPHRRLTPTDL